MAKLPVKPRLTTSGDASRALWMSTLAFTVCFAVWTIFSIIGIRIKDELGQWKQIATDHKIVAE